MKIEAGRFYRARNGIIYGPMIRVPGKVRLPFRVENVALDWREDGFFQSDRLESEHDLISEVYVSDTPPVLAVVRTGGGGGEAPAPEAKTLRDEFAFEAMKKLMDTSGLKAAAHHEEANRTGLAKLAYGIADAMMEAREK